MLDPSPPSVPYQAYKSKRHSRTVSNTQLNPGAAQRETTGANTPRHSSQSLDIPKSPPWRNSDSGRTVAKSPPPMFAGHEANSHSPDTVVHTKTENPAPDNVSIPATPPAPQKMNTSAALMENASPLNGDVRIHSPSPPVSPSPSSSAPSPLLAQPSLQVIGEQNQTGEFEAGPSSAVLSSPATSATASKRSSTFRYVPLRPPVASSSVVPQTPSPLRPRSTHLRTLSGAPRQANHIKGSVAGNSSRISSPTEANLLKQTASNPQSQPSHRPSPSLSVSSLDMNSLAQVASSPSPHATTPDRILPPPRTTSLITSPQSNTSPNPIVLSTPALEASTSAAISRSSSSTPGPSRSSTRSNSTFRSHYRPGFQPHGVSHPRTDDFIEIRAKSREQGRVERTRLERRFEKLVELHFSDQSFSPKHAASLPEKPNLKQTRRTSSFFDLDFNDLRSRGASELWRSVIENRTAALNGKRDAIRAEEQRITPWQDDADVSECPHCSTSFHPLTNRKHHCRLCGRIICSLPVKHPNRPVPCSFLFISDLKTGIIEEVNEGVDYGVRSRSSAQPTVSGGKSDESEKFLKGVRICRECKPIMLRQQKKMDSRHVPTYARLYEALTLLEAEIEEALPQFQELMLSLANNPDDAPSKEASAARKRLLDDFADYDALAKSIRKLPCPGGSGSSQDRIQAAILTRANLFLQKNMIPLQSLPKPKKRNPTSGPGQEQNNPANSIIDLDSKLAHSLQPLLEQEALLESFIEEATTHRKFEDVRALRANLKEIREEIERIVTGADNVYSSKDR